MKVLISMIVILSLVACMADKMSRVQIGMSRDDVIKQIGTPSGTGANNGKEYLNYRFYESAADYEKTPYTVVLENGKVVSYGRHGQVE